MGEANDVWCVLGRAVCIELDGLPSTQEQGRHMHLQGLPLFITLLVPS